MATAEMAALHHLCRLPCINSNWRFSYTFIELINDTLLKWIHEFEYPGTINFMELAQLTSGK